jgi:hypothetical protein
MSVKQVTFSRPLATAPYRSLSIRGTRRSAKAEAVKPGEASCGYLVCMRASGVGWLIQATVGSFGGVGGRANRAGWAA